MGVQNPPSGLSLLDIPSPPPLPPPGALAHYTLENPWPLFCVFLLGALVAYSMLNARGQTRRGAMVAGAFSFLAAGVLLLAHFVTTAREAIARDVKGLVGAVAACDIPALEESLSEDCTLYYFRAPDGVGRAGILTAVAASFAPGAEYRIKEWKLEAVQAFTRDARTGQAQVKVFAVPESWGFPHHSWWRIDVVKGEGGKWQATAITPLEVQGLESPRGR